jgi:hypothetical protein
MKMMRLSIALLGTALLFSSGAIAKDNNKTSLNITEKVTVEGKTLDPGRYKVEWNGAGPTVQVTVLRGKETVATFPARVTEQAAQNQQDAYGTTQQPDGTVTLTSIYPGGRRSVLQVDQVASSNQQSGSQGSR